MKHWALDDELGIKISLYILALIFSLVYLYNPFRLYQTSALELIIIFVLISGFIAPIVFTISLFIIEMTAIKVPVTYPLILTYIFYILSIGYMIIL